MIPACSDAIEFFEIRLLRHRLQVQSLAQAIEAAKPRALARLVEDSCKFILRGGQPGSIFFNTVPQIRSVGFEGTPKKSITPLATGLQNFASLLGRHGR